MPSGVVRFVIQYMPVKVVRGVIQHEICGISMRDSNNIAFGAPLFVVTCQEIQVTKEERHVTSRHHQVAHVKDNVRLFQFYGNVDVKCGGRPSGGIFRWAYGAQGYE